MAYARYTVVCIASPIVAVHGVLFAIKRYRGGLEHDWPKKKKFQRDWPLKEIFSLYILLHCGNVEATTIEQNAVRRSDSSWRGGSLS